MCEGDAQPGLCDHDYCECYDPTIPHEQLVKDVKKAAKEQPSGLPDCKWIAPDGCTNDSPYECIEGASAGECQGQSWHRILLKVAPERPLHKPMKRRRACPA